MDPGGWLPDVGAASFGLGFLSGANRTWNSVACYAVSPADHGDYEPAGFGRRDRARPISAHPFDGPERPHHPRAARSGSRERRRRHDPRAALVARGNLSTGSYAQTAAGVG